MNPQGETRCCGATCRLEERAGRLRSEADELLQNTGVIRMLSQRGSVFVGGSFHSDLLVWRDLDLYVDWPNPAIGDFFALGGAISAGLGAWKSLFIDGRRDARTAERTTRDHRRRLDGLYWGIRLGDMHAGAWKIDIWAVGNEMFERVRGDAEAFARRLDPEVRRAMLHLKEPYWREPRNSGLIRTAKIYEAVLEGGVRTLLEFEEYLAAARDHDWVDPVR